MSGHRFPCDSDLCDFCQGVAESRAADIEPDYDETAAENAYERSLW